MSARTPKSTEAPFVKLFRSKALLGNNTRGVLKSVNGALGVCQSATADQGVDNGELSYAAAHGLGPTSGFICDGIEQNVAMSAERRLAEPRDADCPGAGFLCQSGREHRLDRAA